MPRHVDPPAARARMTPEERRRQLLGIGLRKFVDRPVQELSLDDVAAEAGVSRGLLFHYFPTKTAYHEAVIAAAGRRVLRTVRPDAGVQGEAAVRQIVGRFLAQIVRRREFYVALVFGRLGPADSASAEPGVTAKSLRESIARLVAEELSVPEAQLGVVQAWVAYAEDRALQFAGQHADGAGAATPATEGAGPGDDAGRGPAAVSGRGGPAAGTGRGGPAAETGRDGPAVKTGRDGPAVEAEADHCVRALLAILALPAAT